MDSWTLPPVIQSYTAQVTLMSVPAYPMALEEGLRGRPVQYPFGDFDGLNRERTLLGLPRLLWGWLAIPLLTLGWQNYKGNPRNVADR
jgi:hypothetical protein